MEAKITAKNRDAFVEANKFEEMMKSAPFAMVVKRIESELERERKSCEGADGEVEIRRAQGAVAALRVVLKLPANILAELRAKP